MRRTFELRSCCSTTHLKKLFLSASDGELLSEYFCCQSRSGSRRSSFLSGEPHVDREVSDPMPLLTLMWNSRDAVAKLAY